MNSENNFERTVDLTSFLKVIFKNWRQMLILGFICALLLGMVPVYEYKTEKSKKSSQTSTEEAEDTGKYITSEEYNASLNDLEQKLFSKKQYLINSILMKIDPFSEVRARKYLYIDLILEEEDLEELNGIEDMLDAAAAGSGSSENENTETAAETDNGSENDGGSNAKIQYLLSRVISDYDYFIRTRIDWTELSEKLGIEGKYLRECVNIDAAADKAKITICIKHYDADEAEEIANYVVQKILEEKQSVIERFSNHDINVQDGGIEVAYDTSMKNYQENFVSELATTQTRYDNFKSAKSDFVYNAPSSTKLDKKAILRNLIVGFVGGCLIIFAISAVMVFAGGKVISTKELSLSYDLKPLASLTSTGKKKAAAFVDTWIENIGLGADKKLSEEERYKKAAQMTELYALDAEKLTLTGDVTIDELQKVKEKLQSNLSNIELVCCDTLLGHTSELRESNGVILVEKKNSSRMSEIETDIGIIAEMKMPIIGVILL